MNQVSWSLPLFNVELDVEDLELDVVARPYDIRLCLCLAHCGDVEAGDSNTSKKTCQSHLMTS
jgi:hypothetical protein